MHHVSYLKKSGNNDDQDKNAFGGNVITVKILMVIVDKMILVVF